MTAAAAEKVAPIIKDAQQFRPADNDEGALRVEHLPENWQHSRPPARPFILFPNTPRRATSTLLGAGTASKTLVVCEWATAITTGTAWREHSVLDRGGDVVILTWEDETADYHAKLHSLLNYARPDLLPCADQIRKRLHIIPMHGSPHRLVSVDERGRPAPTMLPAPRRRAGQGRVPGERASLHRNGQPRERCGRIERGLREHCRSRRDHRARARLWRHCGSSRVEARRCERHRGRPGRTRRFCARGQLPSIDGRCLGYARHAVVTLAARLWRG